MPIPWPPKYEDSVRRHVQYLEQDQALLPSQVLRDLGLDSLSTVRLLIDLENQFDVQIPDEQISGDTFKTAGSLWEVLSPLLIINDDRLP